MREAHTMRMKKRWPLDEEWGDPVEVDGAWLPSQFTVVMEHDDPPTTVRLRVGLVDGQWKATELSFINPDGIGLRTELLEEVVGRLPKLVTREVLQLETMPLNLDGRPMAAEDEVTFERKVEERQRRRAVDTELLTSVSRIYTSAPEKPLKTVARHFIVSEATASRWIKLARERGLLKPKEA